MDEILCRACLAPQGKINHKSIFIENGKIAKDIYELTNIIMIDFTDLRCPAVICQRCLMDLERAISFRDLIIKSNSHLRDSCNSNINEVLIKLKEELTTNKNVKNSKMKARNLETIVKAEIFDLEVLNIEPDCDVETEFLNQIEPKNVEGYNEFNQFYEKYPTISYENDMPQNFKFSNQNIESPRNPKIGRKLRRSPKIQKKLIESVKRLNGNLIPSTNNFESFKIHEIHSISNDFGYQSCIQQSNDDEIDDESYKMKKRKRNSDDINFSYSSLHLNESVSSSKLKCRVCHKEFSRKCYLTQHFQTQHAELKPYRCVKCGKRYSDIYGLNAHMIKHGGDKPFKCQICSRAFNHKADCKRHERNHSMQKPFNCTICDKGFVRNDHLNKHIEMHKRRLDKSWGKNEQILGDS